MVRRESDLLFLPPFYLTVVYNLLCHFQVILNSSTDHILQYLLNSNPFNDDCSIPGTVIHVM